MFLGVDCAYIFMQKGTEWACKQTRFQLCQGTAHRPREAFDRSHGASSNVHVGVAGAFARIGSNVSGAGRAIKFSRSAADEHARKEVLGESAPPAPPHGPRQMRSVWRNLCQRRQALPCLRQCASSGDVHQQKEYAAARPGEPHSRRAAVPSHGARTCERVRFSLPRRMERRCRRTRTASGGEAPRA